MVLTQFGDWKDEIVKNDKNVTCITTFMYSSSEPNTQFSIYLPSSLEKRKHPEKKKKNSEI